MSSKRRASPAGACAKKRKLLESRCNQTFDNDVVISLGTREVELRMAVLRDKSGYFADLRDGEVPKRFALTPGDDVDDILQWRLLPTQACTSCTVYKLITLIITRS